MTLVEKKLKQLSHNYPSGIAISLHNDSQESYAATRSAKIGDYDTLVSRFQLALRGLGGAGCNPVTGTPGAGGCQWFNPFSNAIQSNYITGQTNPNYSAAVANDRRGGRLRRLPAGRHHLCGHR